LLENFKMSQPIVVSIPHGLGKEEAARRLKAGFEKMVTTVGGMVTIDRQDWTGDDHLDFGFTAMGQTASGTMDVTDSEVKLELILPGILGMIANKVKDMITQRGQILLEKK
jgi:hypothetical protein